MTRIVVRVRSLVPCSFPSLPCLVRVQRAEPAGAGVHRRASLPDAPAEHSRRSVVPAAASRSCSARSQTLRRQWQTITASPSHSRIPDLVAVATQDTGSTRARTEVSRYAHGRIRAMIEIPERRRPDRAPAARVRACHRTARRPRSSSAGEAARAGRGRGPAGRLRDRAGAGAGLQVYREVYGRTDARSGRLSAGVHRALGPASRGHLPRPKPAQTPRAARQSRPAPAVVPGAHPHKRW